MGKRIALFCVLCVMISGIDCRNLNADVQRLPVFLYHHILPEADNELFVDNGCVISLEAFEEHMRYLSDNDFHTVTMQELYGFLYEKKDLPDKSVMLTFDDGYMSNYQFVYPILKEYGFTACVFVITGAMERKSLEYDPDMLQMMSWEQINRARGVFEYASHTDALHVLESEESSLLVTKPADVVRADLKNSLDRVDNRQAFAYPYGLYNDETTQMLKEMKFSMAFGTQKGYVTKDSAPYELKRITVFPSFTLDVFKKEIEKR